MTDAYTVLATRIVEQQTWNDTYEVGGCVANAILDDGSFFLAAWLQGPWSDNGQYIRMWRLGADGSLLGSSDVLMPLVGAHSSTNSVWPIPYAMAVSGMKVLMVSGTVWNDSYRSAGTGHRAYASWMVDCSGNVPVAGPQTPMPTTFAGRGLAYTFWSNPVYTIYDKATDRVILATHIFGHIHSYSHDPITVVQVFKGGTGELLCEVSSESSGLYSFPTGLYMDPADPTKFTVCTADVDSFAQAYRFAFTITGDGHSGSFDGSVVAYNSPDGYQEPVAGGSPYIVGGGGLLTEEYGPTSPYPASLNYVKDGARVATYSEGDYVGMQYGSQTSNTLRGGRDIFAFFEAFSRDPAAIPPHDHQEWYFGRFAAVDQLLDPLVVEVHDLEYVGLDIGLSPNSPPYFDYTTPIITADEASGIIIISTTIYSYFRYPPDPYNDTVMLWIIQGPVGGKPNLVGSLLDDRVRFHGK